MLQLQPLAGEPPINNVLDESLPDYLVQSNSVIADPVVLNKLLPDYLAQLDSAVADYGSSVNLSVPRRKAA